METEVDYCFHKRPPPVPILNQTIPVHNTLSYLCKIHHNIIHPPMFWSS
jgi:hypothetical protein